MMGKARAKIGRKLLIPPLLLLILLAVLLSFTLAAGQTTGPPQAEDQDSTKAKLRSIAKLGSVAGLAELAGDPEEEVRAAVVARLELIGGEEAVPVLEGIFSREERVAGTGIGSGIRGDCLRALARGRSAAAGEALRRILKGWIKAGPVAKGPYAHIYDSQYHAVLLEGIGALESFPGPETAALLRSLSDDTASFYTIREQAQTSLLALEMAEKGFRSPSEGTAFLLERIQPAGVLTEDWWSEPSHKKPEAIREAAVERMVVAGGRESISSLLAFLGKTDARDHPRRAAAARMLTSILSAEGESLGAQQRKADKEALAAAVAFLEDLPPGYGASPTVHEIFQSAVVAADNLQDREIYSRLRKVREGIDLPGAWKAPPPTAKELGLAIPAESMFLPRLSSMVETPWGMLATACYASPIAPGETVAFFEQTTGRKAEARSVLMPVGPANARWVISLEESPPELAGLVVLGVEVLAADNGFEIRDLGEITAKGRAMFRIIRLRK